MENNNGITRRNFISLTAHGVIISAFLPSALQAAVAGLPTNLDKSKNTNKYMLDSNLNIQIGRAHV